MIVLLLKSQGDLFGTVEKLVPVKGSVSKDGHVTQPHMAIRHVKRKPVSPAHHAAKATGDLFDAPAPNPAEKPVAASAETQQNQAPKPEKPSAPKNGERHTYGLTMRAADASALPDGYIPGSHRDSSAYKFGTADFSRKLSDSEVRHFDLVDLAEERSKGERNDRIKARIASSPVLTAAVNGSGVDLSDIDDALLDEIEAAGTADKVVDTTADISAAPMAAKVNYDGPFDPDTVPDFGVVAGTSKEARRQINATGYALSNMDRGALTDADIGTLRQYSGNGGCGDSLNEFYTDPKVAAAMWKVLHDDGLRGGDVLEPSCATGVFMETAPAGVRVQGVELDGTSAKIASLLHPQHAVVQSSLEGFATTDDRQFDAVIGNAPFGLRGSLLSQDKKDLKTAEAYFMDTAIDKTKPGGVVAMIVPTGLMDSRRDRKVRERLLRKAEFAGAIRMPNTAFEHSHTGVTTDVVFFRKRPEDVAGALSVADQGALKTLGLWDDEFLSGGYFAEDGRGADNILGSVEAGWRAKAGMGDDITVVGSMAGVPDAIAAFALEKPETPSPTVADVLAALPDEDARERARGAAARRPYDTSKRGDVKTVDGIQYILEGEPLRWHRVDDFLASKAVTDAQDLSAQIEMAMADDGYAAASGLADKVKAYVEAHGIPSKNSDLMLAASRDKLLYRLVGAVKADGSLSDVVTGRKNEVVESSFDAAAAVLALEHGSFTPAQLAARWAAGDSEAALDHLYASPEYALLPGDDGRWTSMDQYLSGNMWEAFDAANVALAGDLRSEDRAKFERQIKALDEAIDPRSLEDVDLQLNTAFIPLGVIEDFWNEKFPPSQWSGPLTIKFDQGVYSLSGGGYHASLLDRYLNRTGVQKERDVPVIDGWNEDFKKWVCSSARRDEVEELYNRSFRGFRQREFSNAPFEVPGLNAEGLKDYQWGGVRWALEAGKGIIAADVGLGKTARGLILARMLKATGRAQRPIIVVPKSVLANWAAEAEKWFPGSNVLTIGETYSRDKKGNLKSKQDSAAERNRKLHDMSQNDYDFILISQPAWNDIDLDPETKAKYVEDDFWVQRGESLGKAGDKRVRAIRERHDQSIAGRDFERRTGAAYFNELGIDAVIADEMHAYKNLYAAKNRFGSQPKFLGGQGLSNRALDMSLKARWIRDHNGGNNVYGLTATPTKNSPLEIYSMLSHIAPEAFERIGIRNSEEFLDRFCEFRDENVLTTGGAIENTLVTVGFKNLDELREVMRRYIDRKTAEDVGLILPSRDDRQHLVDMTPEQQAVYADLRDMAEKASGKDATGDAHIFSIMAKMGKAAMDLELYDSAYAGSRSPKYDAAAAQVTLGAQEGGQVVFIDSVDSHAKMVDALVASGISRDQIGVINAQVAATSAARQNIADKFNAGILKVVIGNTATMGEGINLQKGTTDIHHLDLPWEPASMQQRNGRGLRQGNISESVRIHTYLAKGSFDGYRYQSMTAKKDWQDLLWSGGNRVENLAREGALSRDDLMIMLSADPDKAREELAKNKAAAEAKFAAQQTEAVVIDFNRYREMKQSLKELGNKKTPATERLNVRVQRLRAQLEASPWFKPKAALDGEGPVFVHPTTGEAYEDGYAFEVGEGAADPGKYIVTHIAGGKDDPLIYARRYGAPTGGRVAFQPKDLAHDTKSFDYDAAAENAEIAKALADGMKDKPFKSYADLQVLPSNLITASHDAIQRKVKDGMKAYTFTAGHGDVGFVKDGRAVRTESYSAKNLIDSHDVMLPTAEHRELAIQAYMEAERGKRYAREYVPVGRGKYEYRTQLQYPDTSPGNKTMNPWRSIGNTVFGSGFADEAQGRLDSEHAERAKAAGSLSEAVEAVAPTASAHYGSVPKLPKIALSTLWDRAEKDGVLDQKMADHVPNAHQSMFSLKPPYHGASRQYIGEKSVADVLTTLASEFHPDLAPVFRSRLNKDAVDAA